MYVGSRVDRAVERSLLLLVHSPKCPQAADRAEPGARASILVLCVGGRDLRLGPSFPAFPGVVGNWMGSRAVASLTSVLI